LADGGLTEVWTDGEHVKRPLGAWSSAVHQLLEHLERRDVWGVPRFLATEDATEILTLLEGRTVRRPWPRAAQSTMWMEQVGRWLNMVHTASADFCLDGGAQFAWGPDEPEAHHVVTHGDLGPWNMIARDGRFAGVIDWDLARFGDPLDDLAEVAFELGPLRENREMLVEGATDKAIRTRIAALCGAYGGVSPERLLRHVEPLYQRRIDETVELAERGRTLFFALEEAGSVDALRDDLKYFREHNELA
jgi:Ser/Thr protein kinase RdoA (MazF antagonist)